MAEEKHCDECGGNLTADTPQGLCPQCLMKLGLPSDAQSALPTSPTAPVPFVPPEPKELAKKFPQLEIIELLGQGGMGAVYKARQKHLDRLVALKILPPQIGQDPAFAERFTREARSLARLNHPRIVTVFEFGHTEDGLYYFIMEYIDGTDLRQVINAADLSPKEALAIVPQICEALQFAHEEGIVHRDIKPENILIDKKGRIKIADFGLARLLDQPAKDYTLTQAGQRMGTPHYMAPEQIEHPGQVDHRADIYSLGVVFYEMLTGELPIGRFDPPSQRVQIDVRLDEIVLHTLEKEPQRRYQHASELKTDVETVSASPQAPPPPQQQHLNQRQSSPMNAHITAVAILSIINKLFIGALLFTIITGIGLISGDLTAMAVMGIIGTAIAMIVGLMAIPTLIGCFGLLKRRPWARILMIILAILDLAIGTAILVASATLWPMIGIALAVYTLWVLLSKEGARLFQTPSAPDSIPQTSHSPQSPLPTTASPTKPSHPTPHIPPSPETSPAFKQENARSRIRVPAIALIIAGILSCLVVPAVLGGIILIKLSTGPIGGIGLPIVQTLFLVLTIIAGILITVGASKMLHLRSYSQAVATAILALLPCYAGFPIGLPFAIWALVLLSTEKVQAGFAKAKQQPRLGGAGPITVLIICLILALIIVPAALLVMRHLAASKSSADAADTPSPLSLMQKSIPTTIANLDFPQGQPDYIAQDPNGPTLTERGALFCNLDPNETNAVTNILQKANARYLDLEKQHTRQSRTDNTLTVIIEPFRDQAKAFLEQLWTDIDAALAPEKHAAAHKHLPLCPIFGTWRFGQTTMIIEITHKPPFFDYQVSYNLDKQYSGPSGRHSYHNRRSLPPEIQQFWQKAETPPLK